MPYIVIFSTLVLIVITWMIITFQKKVRFNEEAEELRKMFLQAEDLHAKLEELWKQHFQLLKSDPIEVLVQFLSITSLAYDDAPDFTKLKKFPNSISHNAVWAYRNLLYAMGRSNYGFNHTREGEAVTDATVFPSRRHPTYSVTKWKELMSLGKITPATYIDVQKKAKLFMKQQIETLFFKMLRLKEADILIQKSLTKQTKKKEVFATA